MPSGLGIPQLLEAVLKLLPLDTYVESPVSACPACSLVSLQGPVCLEWGGRCPRGALTLIRGPLSCH